MGGVITLPNGSEGGRVPLTKRRASAGATIVRTGPGALSVYPITRTGPLVASAVLARTVVALTISKSVPSTPLKLTPVIPALLATVTVITVPVARAAVGLTALGVGGAPEGGVTCTTAVVSAYGSPFATRTRYS